MSSKQKKVKDTLEKEIYNSLVNKNKSGKKRKRKPMSDFQKAAAAKRLEKARAARKSTNKQTHHHICYDEKERFWPIEDVLSWLKNAKNLAAESKKKMNKRNITNKEFTAASDEYHWWYGYQKDIQKYLSHGDWTSNLFGMNQERKCKLVTIVPSARWKKRQVK